VNDTEWSASYYSDENGTAYMNNDTSWLIPGVLKKRYTLLMYSLINALTRAHSHALTYLCTCVCLRDLCVCVFVPVCACMFLLQIIDKLLSLCFSCSPYNLVQGCYK